MLRWRMILLIPWTAPVTKTSVLEKMAPPRSVEDIIAKKKLSYFDSLVYERELSDMETGILLDIAKQKRMREM